MFRWAFQFLLVLALSLWVGSLLFFSIIVTPGIFTTLDRPAAGKLLAELFPRYYRTGAMCGAAALLVLMLLFLFDSGSRSLRFLQLILVLLMLSATLYAGWILQPRIHQMRQERLRAAPPGQHEDAEARFQKLHARSVRVNTGVIALGVAGLGTLAIRKKA
jgi:uncharacterized membrane protein